MRAVPTSGRRNPAALHLPGILLLACALAAATPALADEPAIATPPVNGIQVDQMATTTPPNMPEPTFELATITPATGPDLAPGAPAAPRESAAPTMSRPATVAAAMRFSGVNLQGPDERTAPGFVLVDLVLENTEAALTEVPAASGDGTAIWRDRAGITGLPVIDAGSGNPDRSAAVLAATAALLPNLTGLAVHCSARDRVNR